MQGYGVSEGQQAMTRTIDNANEVFRREVLDESFLGHRLNVKYALLVVLFAFASGFFFGKTDSGASANGASSNVATDYHGVYGRYGRRP